VRGRHVKGEGEDVAMDVLDILGRAIFGYVQ
jgi:hypothetical protein